MSIQQKIKETQRAIMLEIGQTKKPVSDQVQALALAAIKEGREAKTAEHGHEGLRTGYG